MPMSDGLLLKLTILPFEDSENVQFGPPAGPPFIAQFNPESFSVSTEFNLGPDEPAPGSDGEEAKFESIKPRSFSFDFLMDGTGANGVQIDVLAQIALFKLTTGFSGDAHRTRFLVLSWGTFLATCVLESYSINYKLFRPSGTPLRATLSAKFREHKPALLNELIKNLQSTDVVRAHQVNDGAHLSLITYRTYKDPSYYYHVAEVNELNTVRHIDAGDVLTLPPLE